MTDDRDWYDLLRRAIDEAIRLADEAEQREAYPSWREVVQAHSDRAAVLTRLFAEELVKLAQEAGRDVPDGWGESPALAAAAWTTGDGVDGDALNLAEWRALQQVLSGVRRPTGRAGGVRYREILRPAGPPRSAAAARAARSWAGAF